MNICAGRLSRRHCRNLYGCTGFFAFAVWYSAGIHQLVTYGGKQMRQLHDHGAPPTRQSCFAYMRELEDYYGISIKFWVSWLPNTANGPSLELHLTGSGQVFDELLPSKGRTLSRIIDGQNGSLYSPMWSTLVQLDSNLRSAYRRDDPSVPFAAK